MRIAVSGKGGSGKTTLAAALARTFARRGYRVNAIDDDPNPNLAVALGLPAPEVERLRLVPQEEIMEERIDEQGRVSMHLTWPLERVVDQFGAHGPDGVDVLTMTGVLGAGKGCICGQHVAVRSLVGEIGQARPDDVTIVDMEASLEHLGRATVGTADVLLLVAEPYFRSLETVGRIVPLARELGVPHLDPVLATADRLVRHHQRAYGADKAERRERRDRDRSGDEGEQHDRSDGPPPKDTAGRSEEERDVR
jgi:CO dehydrogenase maturation factor